MARTGRPSHRAAVLAAMPGTRAEIARKAGVSTSSAGKWLAILRAENIINIGSWRRSFMGAKQPVFMLAPGEDAPPLPSLTPSESQKRFEARNPGRRNEIKKAHYERSHGTKKERQRIASSWLSTLGFVEN